MSLAIRRSGRDEADLQFALQREASLAGLSHIFPPEEYPYPDEAVRERWRAFLGSVLVAEQDGAAVGLAAVEGCWLHGLYVLPAAWGTGVAARAARRRARCAARLRRRSSSGCWRRTSRARRFYEKHGWRRNGEQRVDPVSAEAARRRLLVQPRRALSAASCSATR